MFKFMMSLLICLTVLPLPVLADGKIDYQAAQQQYLLTAKEYQARSRELADKSNGLTAEQARYVRNLSSTYDRLAEIKVALANAIGNRDWSREERLEKQYYVLKDRETALWDALEASKR